MICRCDSFGVNHTRNRVFKLIIIFEVKCFRGGGGKGSKMEQTTFWLDVHCNQNKISIDRLKITLTWQSIQINHPHCILTKSFDRNNVPYNVFKFINDKKR